MNSEITAFRLLNIQLHIISLTEKLVLRKEKFFTYVAKIDYLCFRYSMAYGAYNHILVPFFDDLLKIILQI